MFELPVLHPIQRQILCKITLLPEARYSDLKPEEVDSNLYMYHLNQLMEEGYVIKKPDHRYHLTVAGKRYVGIISVDTGLPRIQPKIVAMLYVSNSQGEYLLYRWKRQPFVGTVSLPYGKTHYGASVWEMAQRELAMKTSVHCSLQYRGDVYVKAVEEGEVVNHMLAHLFQGTQPEGTPYSTVPLGECFWGTIEDFPESVWAPGVTEIIDLIQKSELPIFQEIVVQR